MDTVGQRIRHLRGKLSRADLATGIGISATALAQYERDTQSPGFNSIVSICRHFNVESRWLLFGEGPMYCNEQQPQQQPRTASEAPFQPIGEIEALRQENRELRLENRELRQENRALLKENGDLRVALAELKPRAAPKDSVADVQPDESARKIA